MTLRRAKLFLSAAGVALSLIALKVDRPALTWAAIAVLAVAVGLRFAERKRQAE